MIALAALWCALLNACSEPYGQSHSEPIRIVQASERQLRRLISAPALKFAPAPSVTRSEPDTFKVPAGDARDEAAQMHAREVDPYRLGDAAIMESVGEED